MKTGKLVSSPEFDFEQWAELAVQDPARFEAARAQTIKQAIDRAPQERQLMLRRLQWRVDRVRELKATPMAACIAITDMMWDTFNHLNRSYQWLGQQSKNLDQEIAPLPKAKLLPFKAPTRQ